MQLQQKTEARARPSIPDSNSNRSIPRPLPYLSIPRPPPVANRLQYRSVVSNCKPVVHYYIIVPSFVLYSEVGVRCDVRRLLCSFRGVSLSSVRPSETASSFHQLEARSFSSASIERTIVYFEALANNTPPRKRRRRTA